MGAEVCPPLPPAFSAMVSLPRGSLLLQHLQTHTSGQPRRHRIQCGALCAASAGPQQQGGTPRAAVKAGTSAVPWAGADRLTSVAKFSTNAMEGGPLPITRGEIYSEEVNGFLAAQHVSFQSIGAHPRVAGALQAIGFDRPTAVQELGVPAICEGRDVVLSAETGSGKTLSYLIPLLSLQQSAQDNSDKHPGPQTALIICPNTALCAQVAEVARSLVNESTGQPLANIVAVSNDVAPPSGQVDLLIATPSGLMSKLREWSDVAVRWTKDGFPSWIRYVVADEADLLLSGSFIRELDTLLEVFRLDDRYRLRAALCRRFGLSEAEFGELKYHIRRAGYTDGAEGMLQVQGFEPESDNGLTAEENGFWKRQYVFVAATMPAGGKGSAAADLRKRYPDAAWLNGNRLHMAHSELSHHWENVDGANKKNALRRAVLSSEEMSGSVGRTLVFVNSVAAAEQVAILLSGITSTKGESLKVLQYHRDIPSSERRESLEFMRSEGNAVMVCTDSAARGLDIPGVDHVIQAEFASSAVDFLHRAGRTARAGARGRLTSLYSSDDAALAAAIRNAIERGLPVEKAFSRKRSFRKKIKRGRVADESEDAAGR